jgi:GTP 3',8-cyclase
MTSNLKDAYGREFRYLRLSLTDACNFKCTYCLPDGYQNKTIDALTLPEIERLITAFAETGCQKVRLTGGEPSLRKDFVDIIACVAQSPKIKIVAATSNGFRLQKDALAWYQAGLRHLNISIDSLLPHVFHQITGANKLTHILRGIDTALEIGFEKIKVNCVLLNQLNHHQLPLFLKWIQHKPIDLRFIELMETGAGAICFDQHHMRGQWIKKQLQQQGWQAQPKEATAGPAQNFSHPDYAGQVGLILPYEDTFCHSCNRLRVSSTGNLHLCLFTDHGIPLRPFLKTDTQKNELTHFLHQQIKLKKRAHFLHQGSTGLTKNLAIIGG